MMSHFFLCVMQGLIARDEALIIIVLDETLVFLFNSQLYETRINCSVQEGQSNQRSIITTVSSGVRYNNTKESYLLQNTLCLEKKFALSF